MVIPHEVGTGALVKPPPALPEHPGLESWSHVPVQRRAVIRDVTAAWTDRGRPLGGLRNSSQAEAVLGLINIQYCSVAAAHKIAFSLDLVLSTKSPPVCHWLSD